MIFANAADRNDWLFEMAVTVFLCCLSSAMLLGTAWAVFTILLELQS